MSIRTFIAATAGILLALAASLSSAEAAKVCGPRERIISELGGRFNESRKSLGLSGTAAVVELYVSVEGSWSLVATNTKGIACLIATGEAWQDTPRTVTGQDS
jgi:hypothetical protein